MVHFRIARAASLILAFLMLVSMIPAYVHADPSAGRILTIDDIGCLHNEQVTALTSLHILSFTNVSVAQFLGISLASLLSSYDVLYVHTLFLSSPACQNILNALNARAADILIWFNSGHRGIVAEPETFVLFGPPPSTPVPFAWLPTSVSIASQGQGAFGETATIVSAGNPITLFLTSADLSGWLNSFHCQFSSSKGYKTLVTGTNSTTTAPITIDRVAKASRVVVTCQDATVHFVEGIGGSVAAARLLDNMLVWSASA